MELAPAEWCGRACGDPLMKSHEVLRQAADRIGVKALAAALRLSPALVYKWCQEFDPDDHDAGGALNPLDRLAEIHRLTKDDRLVNWLCHEAGGFFVRNPEVPERKHRTELLVETQRLVHEFSQLLLTVTHSLEDDGQITKAESGSIRNSWELFKSTVEEFSVACENGLYESRK